MMQQQAVLAVVMHGRLAEEGCGSRAFAEVA